MKAWIVAGHYFRILAISSLLTTAFAIFREGRLVLDFSFIFLFSIATGVMTGRKGSRTAAVVICSLLVASFLFGSAYSFLTEDARQALWRPRTTNHLWILGCVRFLALALLPLTLLLRPQMMGTVEEEEAVEAARWTRAKFAGYLFVALLLGGVSTAMTGAAGQIKLWTTSTYFTCGKQMVVGVVTQARADGATPLFISSWVIGESNSSGSSDGAIVIGNRAVRPDIHPHKYLKLMETPAEPADLPNVLLIRADGRLVPLPRRVTLATYGPALTAIMAAKDFDDLQNKLEAALPSVTRTFPPDLY